MAKKTKNIISNQLVKKNEKKQATVVYNEEIKNLLKIIIIICGVLLVFYFITNLVQNKKSNDNISDNVAVIQYNKILVGEILNRKDNNYYVLVEKENDNYVDLYKQYLTSNEDVKFYTVDLSDVFNQNHIGGETIVEGNDVAQYKFSNTTLLKVENGVLTNIYKTKDEIISYFKSL